jgi:thiamine-monophosphate kinase
VSSDTLVEGTHFRLDFASWRQLGWKSCAVNLSDIAAMAGRPRYLTVALTLAGSD